MKKDTKKDLINLSEHDSVGLGERFYQQLFDKRIIYYNGDIDESTIDLIAIPILAKNIDEADIPEDKLEPITIWLNSYGGNSDVALFLINVIENSRIPIHVRVLSVAASAGLYLIIACKRRYASKNTIFLLHKGSYSLGGNANAVEDAMDFYKGQVDAVIVDLILRKTKITETELKKIRRNELYTLAEDACKTYGFIDEII
jgi:ATP-dependent Clp protease protease subunit